MKADIFRAIKVFGDIYRSVSGMPALLACEKTWFYKAVKREATENLFLFVSLLTEKKKGRLTVGIKSVGYGVAGTGLNVSSNIPEGLGKGFLFIGSALVGISAKMKRKAEEYRSIAQGLDLLDAQTVAIADVESYAKEHNCSFNEALIVVSKRVAEKSEKSEKNKAADEKQQSATVEEADINKTADEKSENSVEEEPVDINKTAQKIVVEDEDGSEDRGSQQDPNVLMSVAAGLA